MSASVKRILGECAIPLDPCKHNHKTFHHEAILIRRGKVIARARNRIGSRSRGSGYSNQTIHAEKAVVKKVGDITQLRGASLCVWRVSSMNILPSKPCTDCQLFLHKCMKEYGLSAVYYTDTIVPF